MAEDLKQNRYPADSTQQGSALFRLYCRLLIVTVRLYSPRWCRWALPGGLQVRVFLRRGQTNAGGGLSQVLIHIKAAPATAAPGGPRGQRGEEGVPHPLGRHGAPLVHEAEAHVRVEGGGRGLVQLSEAQAAQVQGAADGDPCRGL